MSYIIQERLRDFADFVLCLAFGIVAIVFGVLLAALILGIPVVLIMWLIQRFSAS